MLNHAEDIGFPRCGQCHEDLVRCPGCRHYEDNRCTHPQAHARYTPDQEAAKACPSFRSRDEERDPRFIANLPPPLWVIFLLMVILLGLAALTWSIDPKGYYFRGFPLALETRIPKQVMVNHPFPITMRLLNRQQRTSTRVYIDVGGGTFTLAPPLLTGQLPVSITRRNGRMLLEYNGLPAGGQVVVQFSIIPLEKGALNFEANVYAPNSHLNHRVAEVIKAL